MYSPNYVTVQDVETLKAFESSLLQSTVRRNGTYFSLPRLGVKTIQDFCVDLINKQRRSWTELNPSHVFPPNYVTLQVVETLKAFESSIR